MILGIHQPEHMPWLGFFDKMHKSEKFIILDDVQFRKNYFQNRNKIIANQGEPVWISVTLLKGHSKDKINEKKIIKNTEVFPKKYINHIYECYKKEKYFKIFSEEFFNLIENCDVNLAKFNMELIYFFRKIFEIDTPILFSSDLKYEGKKSDLNLSLCKSVSASAYLSGPFGKEYLDFTSFKNENINLSFHEFDQKPYDSMNYQPYLSSIDCLFRTGPDYFKLR